MIEKREGLNILERNLSQTLGHLEKFLPSFLIG